MADPAPDLLANLKASLHPDDPAFAAVTRAVTFGDYSQIAAAREMAAPIRELHQPRLRQPRDLAPDEELGVRECACCIAGYDLRISRLIHEAWPCRTALLIYSTEELNHV